MAFMGGTAHSNTQIAHMATYLEPPPAPITSVTGDARDGAAQRRQKSPNRSCVTVHVNDEDARPEQQVHSKLRTAHAVRAPWQRARSQRAARRSSATQWLAFSARRQCSSAATKAGSRRRGNAVVANERDKAVALRVLLCRRRLELRRASVCLHEPAAHVDSCAELVSCAVRLKRWKYCASSQRGPPGRSRQRRYRRSLGQL